MLIQEGGEKALLLSCLRHASGVQESAGLSGRAAGSTMQRSLG